MKFSKTCSIIGSISGIVGALPGSWIYTTSLLALNRHECGYAGCDINSWEIWDLGCSCARQLHNNKKETRDYRRLLTSIARSL